MDISVADAARRLGVGERRVLHLIEAGRLGARRLGERAFLVDGEDVERLRRLHRPAGRPLSQRSSWAILAELIDGLGVAEDLSSSEWARARRRAARADELGPGVLGRRAELVPLRAHPGPLARLREDPRVLLAGAAAARVHRADLIDPADLLDGYVAGADLHRVCSEYRLRSARRSGANLLLRVLPEWVTLPSGRVVPAPLLAFDLIDEGDERSIRAGRGLLAQHTNSGAGE